MPTTSILSRFLQASGGEESKILVDGCFHIESRYGCGERTHSSRNTPVTLVLSQPEEIGLKKEGNLRRLDPWTQKRLSSPGLPQLHFTQHLPIYLDSCCSLPSGRKETLTAVALRL